MEAVNSRSGELLWPISVKVCNCFSSVPQLKILKIQSSIFIFPFILCHWTVQLVAWKMSLISLVIQMLNLLARISLNLIFYHLSISEQYVEDSNCLGDIAIDVWKMQTNFKTFCCFMIVILFKCLQSIILLNLWHEV